MKQVEASMNNGMNGAAPPQQEPMPIQINAMEVAPGVFQLQVMSGCTQTVITLPTNLFEQVFQKGLAEIAKNKQRIVVAPAGSIPRVS